MTVRLGGGVGGSEGGRGLGFQGSKLSAAPFLAHRCCWPEGFTVTQVDRIVVQPFVFVTAYLL